MIKKFKFINLMPLILAASVTVAIIIACGSGNIMNIDDDDNDIGQKIEDATGRLEGNLKDPDFMSSITSMRPSSSSISGKSSSSIIAGNSSGANIGGSSSSNLSDSSSSVKLSSSGESPYILACKVVIDTGTVNVTVPEKNRPEVKCTEKANNKVTVLDPVNDVKWINAPFWRTPQENVYSDIQIEIYEDADTKVCRGLTADCEGTFRICQNGCKSSSSAASSSSVAPSSSSVATSSSSGTPSSSSVTLTCTLPTPLTAGTTVNEATQRGYLRCSNTNAAPTTGTPTWAGTPRAPIASNTVAAAGNYTGITVTANCGTGATSVTSTCNNITISNPPTTITCTLPTTLTAGTTVNEATQRGYLRCSNTNAAPTTGTPTWAGTPGAPIASNTVAAAGSYVEIGVTANCGTGATSVSGNCNNITINAVPSSSSAAPSSSSVAPSSSSVAPSSSSVITYTLACANVPASGTAGTAITPPAVTCNGTAVATGLTWTPTTLNWTNPAAGTYSNVSVSASSGNCSGKTATCGGTLTVAPAPVTYTLTCANVPASGTAGTAITPPVVTCTGSNSSSSAVTTGLTWTPATLSWTNPVAGTYSNVQVSTSSGNCSGKTATCGGTLTVAAAQTCADYVWNTWTTTVPTDCRKITNSCAPKSFFAECGSAACSVTVGGTAWNGVAWEKKFWESADVTGKNVTFSGTFNGIECRTVP